MKAKRTNSSYALPLTVKNFLKITDYESEISYEDTLSDNIDKVEGVDRCDYNGHFGSFIYYTVEEEYDTPKTHDKVEKLVNEWIAKA